MTIKASWQQLIAEQKSQDYFAQLQDEIASRRGQGITVFPAEQDVFNAFSFCELAEVKVVILGQDPYHGQDKGITQAHGLAFSVQKGVKPPPSLVNIYKELVTDIDDFTVPEHGDLTAWAEQGVMLLNTVLTVEQGHAHSHAKLGWQHFTDAVIQTINSQNSGCVFILWGAHAQKKAKMIDQNKHLVLEGPHPSPLSAYRGFFGCQHFSKANDWLRARDKAPVSWLLE
ncbi:uracil-DNA glycosylase [Litorilituus sediminis]|uniref:Uracil-DNA glycosylase n=1 Tax=Litorilituus sediminis TaxID=718192 RepID=A0A4P6P6C5_9GAMM|nr:uracil-DNA glycosylase [Litorilituus sediminis]QBG35729.1 uracil-DNA glycosylase [Litorilituus sediminis]